MDETLEQIQKIANERHFLYRLAGKQSLTDAQQGRIQQINNELPILWDRYRREFASTRRPATAPFDSRRIA
jgi:hypothetical protein